MLQCLKRELIQTIYTRILTCYPPLPNFKGILVANGLGASGLTAYPYLGAELAKLALGQPIELDLNDYDVAGAIE